MVEVLGSGVDLEDAFLFAAALVWESDLVLTEGNLDASFFDFDPEGLDLSSALDVEFAPSFDGAFCAAARLLDERVTRFGAGSSGSSAALRRLGGIVERY